jgi:hypothetical protein
MNEVHVRANGDFWLAKRRKPFKTSLKVENKVQSGEYLTSAELTHETSVDAAAGPPLVNQVNGRGV